jgi:thioredoxin reductase (NADPH)
MLRNLVIIGSGPAGYTAALYAARSNLSPLLLAAEPRQFQVPGGQLMFTSDVENFPGFPDGITGPDLMARMRKQCERFGVDILEYDVDQVELLPGGPFRARAHGEWYEARSLIVATGATARWLDLPGETKYRNHGLSACAVCDGLFYRGREVLVVGGGDTALEEALTLAHHASKVTVVHRRDRLRASKIMQDRAFANGRISFLWNTVVVGYVGESALEAVRVKDVDTSAERSIAVGGLFMGIGHTPNTAFLGGSLELDARGYIVTHDMVRTSVEGVFAAGDVHDRVYRQVVTAASSGCMAAIDAERWLAHRGGWSAKAAAVSDLPAAS